MGSEDTYSMWVIYDHPADYPKYFVARRFEIFPGGYNATKDLFLAKTLDGIRRRVPAGLVRYPPNPTDDPIIIEVWI